MQISRRNMLRSSLAGALAVGAAGITESVHAEEIEPVQEHDEFDVVIVGAGCAGLVAAIEAHDLGAKVCVLEKMDRPDGNAIYALGGICSWGSKIQLAAGIKDTAKDFFDSMMKVSAGRADPTLTQTYTDHINEDVDWLDEKIGVPFNKTIPVGPWPKLGRGMRVIGKGKTGGSVLIQTLLKAAESRKIPFFYEHKGVQLLTGQKGEVIGIRALHTDVGYVDFYAKGGVLLATGGFSANPAMTDRFIGGWASRLVLRGSRVTTGENISLTEPLFAKLVNLDQFHSGPIVGETHVNPADVLNSGYGIIVNLQGKRFVDEKNTYVIKAKACAQLTLENKAFCIVDSDCKALDRVIPKFESLHSPYGKADTIEELAKQVGLPVDATVASVKEYNDALAKKKLGTLNPPNTYPKPFPIAKAPFYAVPYEGGMTATFGGPLINAKCEVQNLEGRSIKGLYAAGNAAGGLFFADYIGGAQLGAATVFGRIAAREMTARAKKAKN